MIRILDRATADKIAAGEIIERPISAVKELVENAIDAFSDSITVEIENGGKTYIRITDNGSGIEAGQLEVAFKRHATSKINDIGDLDTIETLGFRGEALPSIAAVSRVEVVTRTRDAEVGRRLVIEGGRILENVPIGCETGTTVIVRDLFYNTPARLKFMKSIASESKSIIGFISKAAMAYPNIKWRIINNHVTLFKTRAASSRHDNIFAIYGKTVGRDLIPVERVCGSLQLECYISDPGQSLPTRRQQIFFVNGRIIRSKTIEKAISAAYADRLFKGRHPICYLFLKIEPEMIDVNIHPDKKEVKFRDAASVERFLEDAIRQALLSKASIPKIDSGNIFTESAQKASISYSGRHTGSHEPDFYTDSADSEICENKKDKTINTDTADEQVDFRKLLSAIRNKQNDGKHDSDATSSSVSEKTSVSDYYDAGEYPVDKAHTCMTADTEKAKKHEYPELKDLKIIGTIFDTYIIGKDSEQLYLVDQHAAHERIFFEKFMYSYENAETLNQPLMIPVTFNVAYDVKSDENAWIKVLENTGFEIEAFGPRTYKINAIPAFMDTDEAGRLINDFTSDPDTIGSHSEETLLKIATRACKSAVKANDKLNENEQKTLLKDLAYCRNPYSCPHGRPTLIKLTKYQIERMFKRV